MTKLANKNEIADQALPEVFVERLRLTSLVVGGYLLLVNMYV